MYAPPFSVPVFPFVLGDLPRVSLSRRESPVRYDHALTLRFDSKINGIPEQARLQKPRASQGDGWSVACDFEWNDEGAVAATLTVTLSRTRYDPEEFDELKEFWRAAQRAAGSAIAIVPPGS